VADEVVAFAASVAWFVAVMAVFSLGAGVLLDVLDGALGPDRGLEE